MTEKDEDLDALVGRLLADPQYETHPLRAALVRMRRRSAEEQQRAKRITRISDRYQAMLRDLNAALQQEATHDALTGIGNRALLMERLREESDRSARSGKPYALAMLDADRFKQLNDTWGHAIGDRVLVALSQAIQAAIRPYDLCGRWGGEEFLLLLPESSLDQSRPVIHRVLDGIATLQVQAGPGTVSMTASIGVAAHVPGENYTQTLERADLALYQAKRNGRNQCVYSD